MADAKHTDAVEWQASANGGRWTRIQPPKGQTLQQRIDYLRSYTRGDGSPAYRIRCMIAETPQIAAASELLEALQAIFAAMHPDIPGAPGSAIEKARAAIAKATGAAS